eukprot:scaffold434_cov186-Pinguiococcus_pyrenoidosus.AAC.31
MAAGPARCLRGAGLGAGADPQLACGGVRERRRCASSLFLDAGPSGHDRRVQSVPGRCGALHVHVVPSLLHLRDHVVLHRRGGRGARGHLRVAGLRRRRWAYIPSWLSFLGFSA